MNQNMSIKSEARSVGRSDYFCDSGVFSFSQMGKNANEILQFCVKFGQQEEDILQIVLINISVN
jgi:hypothetical protein